MAKGSPGSQSQEWRGCHAMNISMHIERLVLEGLPITSDNHALLRAAVEDELTRLLAGDLIRPIRSSNQARIFGNEFQIQSDKSVAELGVRIGQAVFATLGSAGFPTQSDATRASLPHLAQVHRQQNPSMTNQ